MVDSVPLVPNVRDIGLDLIRASQVLITYFYLC